MFPPMTIAVYILSDANEKVRWLINSCKCVSNKNNEICDWQEIMLRWLGSNLSDYNLISKNKVDLLIPNHCICLRLLYTRVTAKCSDSYFTHFLASTTQNMRTEILISRNQVLFPRITHLLQRERSPFLQDLRDNQRRRLLRHQVKLCKWARSQKCGRQENIDFDWQGKNQEIFDFAFPPF